jgi:hypothetical protein
LGHVGRDYNLKDLKDLARESASENTYTDQEKAAGDDSGARRVQEKAQENLWVSVFEILQV